MTPQHNEPNKSEAAAASHAAAASASSQADHLPPTGNGKAGVTPLAIVPATAFTDNMNALINNAGGNVQTLPYVNVAGGKQRGFFGRIALGAQPSGTVIGVARIPLGAVLTSVTAKTDTSLGTATIAFGDANNPSLYSAPATLTAINTKTDMLLTSQYGVPILIGYDCVTGNQCSAYLPGQGGANYEDIVLTTGAAGLPASGNLVTFIEYMID